MEDTNKSFDDWYTEESPFKGNENNEDCKWASKFMQRAYEAGASSRQGEVDELNFQLAEMKSRLNEAYTDGQSSMYKTKQAEIDELKKELHILQGMCNAVSLVVGDLVVERDELQNRIDESLVKIFEWYDQTYRDDAHQLIGELEDILKGNTNE